MAGPHCVTEWLESSVSQEQELHQLVVGQQESSLCGDSEGLSGDCFHEAPGLSILQASSTVLLPFTGLFFHLLES